MSRPDESSSTRGLTLIEVLITLSLSMLVMGIFYEVLIGATRASMFAESQNDIAGFGQRAVNAIHSDVLQAKFVFAEDGLGGGYRTLFTNALPTGTTVWTNSRMPIIDGNTTVIGPDPGPNGIATRTGNSLILVRGLPPVSISYNHDNNSATPNINFQADRYELVYYFLRQNPARSFGGLGYYLDLMEARSQVVGDYFQLSSITVNQAQLVQGLRALNPPVLLAWNPGKTINTPAFYNLTSGGTLTSNTSPTFTVKVKTMLPELAGGRISGKMEYSVSPNGSATMALQDRVPLYASASSNFPGGLEFMVVGQVGARKVLVRLVMASESMRIYKSQEAVVISCARGF